MAEARLTHFPRPPSSVSGFPRVLIVNGLLSTNYGTGVYLRRIFSAWPKERLVCAARTNSLPDFSRCEGFYRLGTKEFRYPPLLAPLFPFIRSGPVSGVKSEGSIGESPFRAPPENRRLTDIRLFMRRVLGGGDILYRTDISRQFLDWVQDFQPEVIYGQCSTLSTAQFLRRIQEATGLPLVLHCMDDFAEGHYRAGWGKAVDGHLYRKEFKRLMQVASGVIAICKEMADEYQTRYGRAVTWIDMPADITAHETVRRMDWTQPKEFRIRYGGRVGWGIRSCLAEIALAVQELRQEGHPIVFDIVRTNVGEVLKDSFHADGVRVLPPEPLDQVPSALAGADALVVCYDFDEQSYRQARLSMPSKLPECMASGTPVIVYGPAGLPVVEYARREQWGVVIESNDIQAVKDGLLQLMYSDTARKRLATTATALANRKHSAYAVSLQLEKILSQHLGNAASVVSRK